MPKRKANSEEECPLLVKNLRRSISEFVLESEFANISGDTNVNIEVLDYGGEVWELYRQRLATFDLKSRIFVSKQISPVECARHGWKNIEDDFLECDDCVKVLYVKMPEEDVSNRIFNRCIWYMQRRLVEAHTVICPWRTNGGLSTSNPYDIIARYKILSDFGRGKGVPFVKATAAEEEVLKKFGEDVNQFFLQMAIFGWLPVESKKEEKEDEAQFSCHLCGRLLKCCVFTKECPLNPLENHYSYCPILDKIYPLWRESLRNVHKLKRDDKLIPNLWNVKSMLKRIFGSKEKKGGDPSELPPSDVPEIEERSEEERRKSI